MSVQNISEIGQVCAYSVNPARVESAVYFYDTPKLGMALYKDTAKTIPYEAGVFGLKFEGKTYKIQVNEQGVIIVFDGECSTAILPKRFIAYQVLNDSDIILNLPLVKEQVDEMVASGVNFLAFTIQLDYLFQSWEMLSGNNSPQWEKYDEFLQHIASKNLPVGIRVHMSIDDNYVPNFYGFDNCEKDEWGHEIRIYYGATVPSMAYSTGVNMLLTFLTKVMDRVYPILGNNLYFVSPTIAATQEFGGNVINRQYPQDTYFAFYDYNLMNIVAFRNAMQDEYGTIEQLKNAWGGVAVAYNSFDDVAPPVTGITNRFSSSLDAIRGIFNNKRGQDWWKFNYNQRKNFGIQCKNIIKSYNQNIKFCLEFGSCNDPTSVMRMSYNVPEMCTWADIVKADFSVMTVNPVQPSMSADWINSLSNKPKFSEIATFDAGDAATAKEYIRLGLDNGLQYASFIVAKDQYKLNEWESYKTIIREIADEYINKDISPIDWQGSVTTTMSECIANWPAVEQKYRDAGGSRNKRIQFNLTNDL